MRRLVFLRALAILLVIAWEPILGSPLEAQISIGGRVQLPGGEPAAGLEIELLPQTTHYELGLLSLAGQHHPEAAARARTGPDGSFRLDASEAGMWKLHVAARGYRPMEHHLVPLLEPQLVPTLELISESTVEIRLLGADGQPAAGARVQADEPSEPNRWGLPATWAAARRQAIADQAGVARLSRAPEEALQIYAWAPGHLEGEATSVRAKTVSLRLEAATALPLTVADSRGQPVEGAQVRIGERRWPIGVTRGNGAITLPMPPEGGWQLRIRTAEGGGGEPWLDTADWAVDQPVRVTLTRAATRSGRLLDRESKSPLAGAFAWLAGEPGAAVLTDSTGGYTLRTPAGEDIWIWGAAAGYLNEGVQTASSAASGPTLSLQRAVRAAGVVVDEVDQPVEGVEVVATVDLSRSRGRSSRGAFRQLDRAVTGPGGRFSIGSLHPEVSYVLQARKPGFAKGELELPSPKPGTASALRITLESGRVAAGSVIGPSGEPVGGAHVRLERAPEGGTPRQLILARMLGRDEEVEAHTDASGRFAMPDLNAGIYSLEASAAGYAKASVPAVEVLAASAETDLGEVRLEPGVPIEGRVTDADGAPIEGAQVLVSDHGSETRFTAVRNQDDTQPAAFSGSDGFFSVADQLAGDKVDLTVQMPGFAAARLSGIEAPTSQPLDVRLERASNVRGQVVDAAGRPIAGAELSVQVHVSTAQMSLSRTGGNATSDENGMFVLRDVDAGELQLTAKADGYRTSEVKSLTVEPGKDLEGVRITMEPGATVSGRVTDPAGRPVASAQLMVAVETRTGFVSPFRSLARSDGQGRYRLEGLSPGSTSITARHEDYEPVTRKLEVRLGDNPLDLAFSGGAEISGRVIDESGTPIAGAGVSIETKAVNRWGNRSVQSDAEGAFSIGGLSEGTYGVRAEREGFAPALVEDLQVGPAGLPGVEIRLSPGLAIVGQLYGLESSDYSVVEIFAVKRPRTWGMGVIGAGGSYRVDDLAPGEYFVNAEVATTGLTATEDVEIFAGIRETVLDLYFKPGLTLTGQVFKGAEPLRGASLSLSGIDVGAHANGTSDHEGRFEIQGVEPGRHALSVSSLETGLDHREELEITANRDVVIRVATARLSGLVLDASDSRPLASAEVRLEPLEHGSRAGFQRMGSSVSSDSSGFFRFSEASVGSYRLLAQKDGYAPEEQVVTLSEGLGQEDLELFLTPTEGIRVFVTLPSGRPAQEFSFSVVDSAGKVLITATHSATEDGGTRLSLPPGTWQLHVAASGTAVWSGEATVPGEPLVVALAQEALLSVSVPELEGSPTRAQVQITGADGRRFRGIQWMWSRDEWPLARGKAVVPGLPPGTWNIRVEAPDGRVWQGQATLAAGENPEVALR